LFHSFQPLHHSSNHPKGKVNYVPVQFLYTSIDPDELTALYAAADVCFVSSTRDGMNLVCYEFVACHSNKAIKSSRQSMPPGSLVLSKFTGAASLLDGALVVNPWNKESCANALAHALSMNPADAAARMGAMASRVEQQTR
jgi:trehalose-6-phosphate synthase